MNSLLPSASQFSHEINSQTLTLVIVSGFLIALVFSLMIFFSVKYRKGSKASRANAPTQSKFLEYLLISVILIFGVSTFVVSAKTFFKMYNPPDNAKEVFVVGKQWLWIFHDPSAPNGNADHLNELTVILNQPVKLTMISEDVIHSFYVPAFRMKQDVLPDRYTTAWFTPTQLGDFEVLCTQYCGLRHSQMRAVIHVVAQAPVVASAPSASGSGNHSVQSPGQKLMQEKGCLSCHAQNGNEPSIGPSLNHLFGTRVALADGRTVLIDEDYLRRALFDPNGEVVKGYSPIMPSFQGSLSEIEGTAIVNAIKNNEVETLITAKDGAKK